MYSKRQFNETLELGVIPNPPIFEGPPIPTEWIPVYAELKSVGRTEFYQSAGVGFKPEKIFEVHSFEFGNHEYVRHDGKVYKILRSFSGDPDIIELVVTLP